MSSRIKIIHNGDSWHFRSCTNIYILNSVLKLIKVANTVISGRQCKLAFANYIILDLPI